MNDYLLAVVLGIVEGLTEFLPVSSTAHLRIVEALLGIHLGDPYWKTFTIVIQLGAVLCLPIYFRARLAAFVRTFPRGTRGDRTLLTHPLTLTLIAFVATAVPAVLLTRVIGKNLESLPVMGAALIGGGVVMAAVDLVYAARTTVAFVRQQLTDDMERMSLVQAVWLGLCQVLAAVFPGLSRSMATITGGMAAGMTRAAAVEFSFFLSIPTMFGATVYDLLKAVRHSSGADPIGAMPHTAQAWIVLAIGFVVSFVVAYAVVAWFMAWVRTHGFAPFAIYRIVVGALVLWWAR